MEWTNHQNHTYKMTPNYLAIYITNNLEFKSVVDLGSGSGNETVYMLKKGKNVTAIDSTMNPSYILDRIPKKLVPNLTIIEETFENVSIPKTDAILSMFSLPFCTPREFPTLWSKIESALSSGGVLAANLFGERHFMSDREDVSTFKRCEVEELLKNFEIVKWKEQEYDRDDGTHWHFYDFVAIKK